MSKLGNERSSVQNSIVQYARDCGWDYVKPDDALKFRCGNTGLLFRELFTNQLLKLNKNFLNSDMIEELIKRIERLPPTIEGNLSAWEYIRGLKPVFVANEKRDRNVTLIDADYRHNVYQVTDEFSFFNGTKTNRYDIVFLINGIPVLFVEAKAVAKFMGKAVGRDSIITEALDQVRRYHNETPEAMTLFQVYTATNIIHFLYSTTWSLEMKSVFNWKTETEQKTFEKLVKSFFEKGRLTKVLLDFIMFTRQDDELKKVILRPHQMRAVDKLVERAAQKNKNRALIWHTQGSGKTYTMIVAAQRILENPIFENPTVVLLVDRNELESQLFGNFISVGYDQKTLEDRTAKTKKHLKDLLADDTRGLIITMIHKFEGISQNVNLRKNIFVLVDEAHRTTGGDLGNYLMGALPNATYLGFTGTPIDKTIQGKGTFVVFGKDDAPRGYLDKYGIAESIEDGTTVKLHYTLAPNSLKPDKDVLDKEFLSVAKAQGVSDIETLNKVLDNAVNLKNMLKNKERIKKVTEFIVKHFRDYIEPMGYKAFLVAVDREACTLYKEELDKLLPKNYSEVVISKAHNDTTAISKYHISSEREKQVRKDFKNPDKKPVILIVTEKLLTGFDAPILYCMYLDKPMRDHVLLQAIARVNRPYEDKDGRKKPSGFVLDFVGIFDKLEKALSFDSGDVSGVVKDIETLKGAFAQSMKKAKEKYLSIIKGKSQDKAVEAVLDHFMDEATRQEFYEFYRQVADSYEIISPDAFLRSYIDEFNTLTRMYKILREAYEPGVIVDKELTRKTAKLVQEHTKSGEIKDTLEIYEINEHTLKKLEDDSSSDTEKVFNLLRSLNFTITSQADGKPYLRSIGEKAELISVMYTQRQKDTQQALDEVKKLIDEVNEATKEQSQKNMSTEIFTTYWVLKDKQVFEPEKTAKKMEELLEQYPHWRTNADQERKLKQEICKIFVKTNTENKKVIELSNVILKTLRGSNHDY